MNEPRREPPASRWRRGMVVMGLSLAFVIRRPTTEEAPAPDVQLVRSPPPSGDAACVSADEPTPRDPGAVGRDTGMAPPPPPPRMRCAIDADVLAEAPSGTVRLDRRSGSAFEIAQFGLGALLVAAYDDVVGGTIYLDGYSPADLHFSGGVCTVSKPVRGATVSGVIVPRAGANEGQVSVQGCGAYVQVDAHGGFFAQVDPGPCTLFAVRRDGAVTVRSTPVELDPKPGEDVVVDLILPTWTAASAGVELHQGGDGAVTLGPVRPGTAGQAAGLVDGEVVLAIDGVDVRGLSLWEISDLEVGPAGSEVRYTVERGGEAEEVTVEREAAP